MAIGVETEPTIKFGKPVVLFNPEDIGLDLHVLIHDGFDVSPIDKRFLMTKPVETAEDESQAEEPAAEEPRKIRIVTNWFEELKEKVPVP